MCVQSAGRFASPFLFSVAVLAACVGPADVARSQPPGAATLPPVVAPTPTVGELIRAALIESLSEKHIDDRHWDKQAERWDGVRVRGLRVSKRTKRVNHGFWRRYTFQLIKPAETLQLAVYQQPPLPDGGLPFLVTANLLARCEGDFVAWSWGVKGVNGKLVADVRIAAAVQLIASPEIEFSLDKLLPEVRLRTRVGAVTLKLRDLHLHEFGLLDGKAAELVGDGSKEVAGEVLERQAGKVRDSLNKSLE